MRRTALLRMILASMLATGAGTTSAEASGFDYGSIVSALPNVDLRSFGVRFGF